MHPQAYDYVKKTAMEWGPFESVLDVGGRNVNGSPKELFPGASYFVLDIVPGDGVDVVADAADWDGEGHKFDCVVSTEMFEHTPRVREIVFNIARILKRSGGGRFIATCASSPRMPHSGITGGALPASEYYSNVEPEAMEVYMIEAGFRDVVVEKALWENHGGDLYATGVV